MNSPIIEKLKPLLLDEEQYVRYNVGEYFYDGQIRDLEITHLIVSACRRYGFEENNLQIVHLTRQPLDAESFQIILDATRTTDDTNTLCNLSQVLAAAPLHLLEPVAPDLRVHPDYDKALRTNIELRRELAGQSGRRLFWRLLDFCREKREDRLESSDERFAEALVAALGERDTPAEEDVVDQLKATDEDDYWTRVYLTDLAGARRMTRAVPLLVDYLGDEGDYLNESCLRALARIGDPDAARLIEGVFPEKDWDFQLFAAGVLEYLKHPECERVLLSLLESQVEPDIDDRLVVALCNQYSPDAVEWARKALEDGGIMSLADIREDLVIIDRIHDLHLPEARQWHEEILALREKQRKRLEQLSLDWPKVDDLDSDEKLEDDDLDDDFFEDDEFGEDLEYEDDADESTPYPGEAYRRSAPKIGRNEPCPCGSGKKYKKCCGRPGA